MYIFFNGHKPIRAGAKGKNLATRNGSGLSSFETKMFFMCADHVGTWPVTGGEHWTPPHLSYWGQGDQQNQGRGHAKEDTSIGAASRMNTFSLGREASVQYKLCEGFFLFTK